MLFPFGQEPALDEWSWRGVHWHAYSLPPYASNPGRRADRLEHPPDAVLVSPEAVAEWIEEQFRMYAPNATANSNRESTVVTENDAWAEHRLSSNLDAASRGDSLYCVIIDHDQRALVKTLAPVRDLYVEAVDDTICHNPDHRAQ